MKNACSLVLRKAAPRRLNLHIHPERVKGLIFLGGFAQGANKRPSANLSQTDLEIQMIQTGWDSDIPAFRQFFANTMIPDSNQAEKDAFDLLMQLSTSAENAAAISRVNAEIDVTNRLDQSCLIDLRQYSQNTLGRRQSQRNCR